MAIMTPDTEEYEMFYDGYFKNGLFHGMGRIFYKDESGVGYTQVEWTKGKKNGEGM